MALKEKLIDKAQKLIQKGYLDKAIIEYRAAVDADPKDISIRLRIGDLYVKLGKNTEAIKEYTEAAKMNAQRGFYLKAIAVYKQVLKLEENLEIHNKLAELYVKQRLIADAIGEYSYIVTWFERRGKTNDVLEILKKMVDIDPDNVGTRLKLAELYQKLSFDKDAFSEYSLIFDKLLAAGKLDTAEKVYTQLYNTNPSEERVLSGLAELYRRKGDNAQRLKFLKGLFNYYSDSAMMDEARGVASAIIEIKPDDPHASRLLKKQETRRVEDFSAAKSEPIEAAKAQEAPAGPLISWPEEEIEITIEGFEGGAAEGNAQVEDIPASRPAETVQGTDSGMSESKPAGAPVTSAPASGEIEIDIEDLLSGELPAVEEQAAPPLPEPEEIIVPEAHVEEAAAEPSEEAPVETVAEEKAVVEAPVEDAGMEEAIAPVIEPPIDDVLEVHERADVITETVDAVEQALETMEEVHSLSALPDHVMEIEPETAAEAVEARPEEAKIETVSPVEILEEERSAQTEEVAPAQPEVEPAVIEAEVQPVEAAVEEELQEDLSSAIQELMDKMEPAEEVAPQAAQPVEAAPSSEEYVDLSVELGMEEASEDLAGSWGKNESAETFDEFKTGIGKQLSKEDSETHYNLGIAYMEMELFGEAAKEFKIALKDSRLELDCYLRLGHCAMAEGSPEEAIVFYSKGLTAASTDEEKKGMMYELALAYEAAGQTDTSFDLFSGVFAMDPDFREVASKVGEGALMRPLVPLNDGLIEVELL